MHEAAERRLHARRGFVVIALLCALNSPPLIYPGTFFWCAPRCGRVLWKLGHDAPHFVWRLQHDGFWQPSAWLLRDRKFNIVVFNSISSHQAVSAAADHHAAAQTQSYPGISQKLPGNFATTTTTTVNWAFWPLLRVCQRDCPLPNVRLRLFLGRWRLWSALGRRFGGL